MAIIDAFASPTIYSDASTYASINDPSHPLTHSQFSQVVFPVNPDLEGPDQCDAAGWYGEETLDVEAVHAMAPGAHIVYVGGSDCLDVSLDKALNKVISEQLAQIVSNSYGDLGEDIPADEVAAFQDIAIQGVVQGIGVYFSSGDSGDEVANLGHPAADFSASSPWVTAVGGTTLGVGELGSTTLQTGWETGKSTLTNGKWTPRSPGAYLYGSGGGTSVLFTQPFYQRGVVPDALATQNQAPGVKGRVVPDISMVGDPTTGMLIGQTQTFPEGVHYDQYRIGGTSLSSPLFAGVVALSDDLLGYHHGFINPRLYKTLNGTAGITDVTARGRRGRPGRLRQRRRRCRRHGPLGPHVRLPGAGHQDHPRLRQRHRSRRAQRHAVPVPPVGLRPRPVRERRAGRGQAAGSPRGPAARRGGPRWPPWSASPG